MKNKIFLSSMLIMSVAPAVAEPSNTGEFPTGGLMQEDYTYTNAATEANMGVYEGSVNATAEYTDDLYNIVAGNYLEAGSEDENGTQCTAGNFCPGLTNALYNETRDQGLNSCSTATNGIYTLSAAGASSQNDCYRECTTADVAHSKGTMNGGYYYGDNNQCEPTDCVNGYHVKPAVPNLTNIIGVSEFATGAGYKSNSGTGSNKNESTYGITQNGEFVVDYGAKGKIHGHAQCSTQSGNKGTMSNGTYPDITTFASLTDETGQEGAKYCYCQLDSYTTAGGDTTALSAPWVFGNVANAAFCASYCADSCATYLGGVGSEVLAFRAAVLGSVSPSPAMCEANVIIINWSNADAEDISANNAGTATYDSDIRTPVKAQTIKGKTFKGWRFSKPEQTTTGN